MTLCYNTVIMYLDRGRRKGVATVAQVILNRTRDLYAAGDIGASTNTVTYRAIISAWARSGR